MNSHDRRKEARWLVNQTITGNSHKTPYESTHHNYYRKYLQGLPDKKQRELVDKVLFQARERAIRFGSDPTLNNVCMSMKPSEHGLVQIILGWPRMGILRADETSFDEAITLYLLYAWEKELPEVTSKPQVKFAEAVADYVPSNSAQSTL